MKVFTIGKQIPVEGGKIIEEFVGNATTGTDEFSVAHMVAPPGWTEDLHRTEYTELVMVIRGILTIRDNEKKIDIQSRQVGFIPPSDAVAFSNIGKDECEYWAVCIPAFSPDRVSPIAH